MAVIDPYTSRVLAGGQVESRASAADFGAGVGQGMEAVGKGVDDIRKAMHDVEVSDEVSRAYKVAADKQLQWDQAIIDRQNQAQPGDRTFAPQLINDIQTDFAKTGEQFKTRAAQELFSRKSMELSTQLGGRAFHIQSTLDGQNAKNEFTSTVDVKSKTVNADETKYPRVRQEVLEMIDDKNGPYALVPQTTRDELKAAGVKVVAASSVEGYFARNIYEAARKLLPDLVQEAYTGEAPTASGSTSAAPSNAKLPAGMRNNNLFNIKYVRQKNSIGPSENLDQGDPQARYASTEDGIAAGFSLALKKYNGGKTTANQLIAGQGGWTPGNTQAAANVAKTMGLGPDDDLGLTSPAALAKFGRALALQEQGAASKTVPDTVLASVANSVLTGTPIQRAVTTDAQGTPLPQLKIPKDASLAPPQNVDIPGWSDLTLDMQQKYMAKLVTDFNSRVTVDRATLNDDRKNMNANLLAGNKYDGMAALQARYVQAYGPEMAARMVKEDTNAMQLGVFAKSVQGKSMDEITAAIGPAPADNATADDYETYRRKVAVVEADRKELQKSPVDYVARNSTPVRQAALLVQQAQIDAEKRNTPDAWDQVARATQNMITSSLAEQRRLGVADPKILSEAAEKELEQRIQTIAASGQNVAQGVDALYRQYGSYGPTVAAQMSQKVGGLMNVLGSGIDPSAASMLVEANRNKKDLEKTLTPEQNKDLDVAVRAVMRDYSLSLAGVPNGMNVQSNYQEQISVLAMARMSKLGESQTEAVQKAYNALVGDQYHFQDGYRVPKALDAGVVRSQAASILANLGSSNVSLLPGSLGNPKDRMEAQLSSIRAHGRWVTTSQLGPDGKAEEGLTLMVPTPGGYAPVPDAAGKPFFRGFGEMIMDYQGRGVQTSQDALMRGDMRQYNRLKTQEQAEKRRREDQAAVDAGRAFRAEKK